MLSPGDPFFELAQELSSLTSHRAYESFKLKVSLHGHGSEDWLQATSKILRDVPADVTETAGEPSIRADVPGVSENDTEVRVSPCSASIAGKREKVVEQIEGKTVYSERRSKQIFRMLDLPSEIGPDEVHATVSDGLLEIKVSKVELGEKDRVVVRAATA